jgi:hypothetical protein
VLKGHCDVFVSQLFVGLALVRSAVGEYALFLQLELLVTEDTAGVKLAELLKTLELRSTDAPGVPPVPDAG